MKKFFAVLLVVTMIASMATVVSAADTTTLTTTVPAATYTLNIPADQEISFGATETNIGNLTVTDASGFAEGKNLEVTVTYDAFKADGIATTIPFQVDAGVKDPERYDSRIDSNEIIIFMGLSTGAVSQNGKLPFEDYTGKVYADIIDGLSVRIESADWGKALAGEYTATITFTCEVVVEE